MCVSLLAYDDDELCLPDCLHVLTINYVCQTVGMCDKPKAAAGGDAGDGAYVDVSPSS
jgi:hypothetical protein